MKKLFLTLIFITVSGSAFGDNSIDIPYEEFKQLYQESIKKQLLGEVDDVPFRYSIDTAFYKMRIKAGGAVCTLSLSGSLISGTPEPFTLFDNRIIIENIIEVSGGSLLCRLDKKKGIAFFPSNGKTFSIKAALFIPAGEDNRSRIISMTIPGAIQNALSFAGSKNIDLLEIPGVKNNSGSYNFSSRTSLAIRYSNKMNGSSAIAQKKELSTRFKPVDSPPIILDTITCFSSFEESGNILSVLVMTIPPEAGDHLKIKSIPATSIWSLKVNGKKRNVYSSDGTKNWILPLAKGKSSHIELALLSKGEKIGLNGRLNLTLPGMNLPARKANIAIGLPPRVQLMSFEGSVSPGSKFDLKKPAEFIGKPYYFSRSFYKGEGISMAISYKEPVKQ